MADRRGKSERRRRNRGTTEREPKLKDKASARAKNNDVWTNLTEWSFGDDEDYEDDIDQNLPDDYYSSNKYKKNQNYYPTTNKSPRHVAIQNDPKNVVVQPSAILKTSSEPHETPSNEYITEQHLNDHQLPTKIVKIFSHIKSRTEIMKILKSIQDEEDRYCQAKDEHGNRTTSKNLDAFPREPVMEHFRRVHYADFEQKDGKQILEYLRKPILRRSLYGVLLFNSDRKIFVVRNHNGIWTAPKGLRKIDTNFRLETITETASRVFNEQICAKHQLTDEVFEPYDCQENQHLDPHRYIEEKFVRSTASDHAELIGLFISHFDEVIVEFELRDAHENQACTWLPMDIVVNHATDDEFDMYYTLRPFIKCLQRRMKLDNTNHNDRDPQRPMKNEETFQKNLNNAAAAINRLDVNFARPYNRPRVTYNLPISDEVFNRTQQCIAFEDYHNQGLNEDPSITLVDNYAPQVLASFNLKFDYPDDHTSIEKYKECISQTLDIPYYRQPRRNSMFPRKSSNSIIHQPKNISLLPLLITAHRNKVPIYKYHVVSERNSFRKIAQNNEDYVVGVGRIGATLFLRRHDNRHVDLNDVGHRFERMCTPGYNLNASYKLLVEGNVGTFKTLITAETDAVRRQTQQTIELKSRLNRIDINGPEGCWLQAFLSNVTSVIVGQCTKDEPPQLVDIHEYDVTNIIDDDGKNGILEFLYRVLRFLQENVQRDETYLLSRRYDHRLERHGLYLYRVADQDKQEFTFITQRMLNDLGYTMQDSARCDHVLKQNGDFL